MASPSRILYESRRLRVVYQPADSELVVFSFNGLDFTRPGRAFFGDRFFAKRGIAAVGIVDPNRAWYPHTEMLKAVQAINAAIPASAYATRIAYGVSMGGYAALKYSRRLAADASLTFGPQWSIDPGLVRPFDQRYADFFQPDIHTGIKIAADEISGRNYMVFDPLVEPDREHAAILARMPNVHRVLGPFLGHPGIIFFTQAKLVEGMLRLALQDRPDPPALRRLIRANRAGSSFYWLGRATHLHRKKGAADLERIVRDYELADRLNDAAPERVDSIEPLMGLAELMLDAGQPDRARGYLDLLWQRSATTEFSRELLNLFLRAEAPARAQAIAERGLEREPMNPAIRLDLVKALMATGDLARANAEIDIARSHAGPRPRVWRRLRWLYTQLGRSEDALAAARTIAGRAWPVVDPSALVAARPTPEPQPASSRLN